MFFQHTVVAALSALAVTEAASVATPKWRAPTASDSNPFVGKELFAPSSYASKLDETIAAFKAQNDSANVARAQEVQKIGTFNWVSNIAGLATIPKVIAEAKAAQRKTGKKQIVGLVHYNLPDRDCSAGESAGELQSVNNGLKRYKSEFVDPFAKELKRASDLTFAVVVEPDSLGNAITNQGIPFCANATPVYEAGIAYAIQKLQLPNVALYLDAAHGGWLGWDDNLEPTAKEFAKVVSMAGNTTKIRGFSTNVSNYNPFNATIRENYTEWSHSWDESHYASSLAPHLKANGLPAHFITDQGRVAAPGARAAWGDWCNVAPAGLGHPYTTETGNEFVDALVWIKPGGESDGACGMDGAPGAGAWFEKYTEMLIKNADPALADLTKKQPKKSPWGPH